MRSLASLPRLQSLCSAFITEVLPVARGAEAGPASSSAAAIQLQACRWASKKQGGSTQNNKDSNPKYLGVKLYGGQHCIPGNIIVRQRGTEFHPGYNVGMGKDHTIYSLVEGHIQFEKNRRKKRTYIHVRPLTEPTTLHQSQQQK